MKGKTTRLELLKVGAVAMGVLATGGLIPVSVLGKGSKKKENSTHDYAFDEMFDVIVIGSGLAGTIAALTAAEKGAKVALLEKMDYLGGSSLKQEFHFSLAGSAEQKKKGIEDSIELLVGDMQKIGENYGQPGLATEMAKRSGELYKLLTGLGVSFGELKQLRGHSVARTLWLEDGGKKVMAKLHAKLNGKCEIRKKCKAEEVLFDNAGRAVGVRVREQYTVTGKHDDDFINVSGTAKVYGVKKAIILANGGYAFDKQFIEGEAKYFGKMSETSPGLHPGATAGLLKSLIKKGVHPVNTALYHFSYPLYERDYYYGMMTDAAGIRLTDEGNPNKFGRISFKSKNKNSGKPPVCIFDQTGFENMSDKKRRDRALTEGKLKKFETIPELASHFGLPEAALAQTIADYHKTIEAGKDEITMKMLDGLKGAAVKKAPFYAIEIVPEMNSTTGGVKVDKKAMVIRMADGKPIKGLFAAGEVAGGIHGGQILEGTCVASCGTYGIIAGEQAVKMEPVLT
ncbi:FAD-dependent oxidoreductase [Bacillus sp. B-jedd]|uniref:FAD-dependent oxidoreductase n=1 Tax=Bacillus sp. B-jedd TaxID=1476857 RepID=UPI0005156D06|nr:FAD-binding protein [Bacillus sp. B-jedd]CEG26504.1 tricarballylate dehydrogenase [Bacillus sp. B-jedd]